MNGENVENTQTPEVGKKGGTGLQSNIAGALSYFLGPVTGILFLLDLFRFWVGSQEL